MKWIKVYVGPGYPVDPQKLESRLFRDREVLRNYFSACLRGLPATAALFADGARSPSEIPRYVPITSVRGFFVNNGDAPCLISSPRHSGKTRSIAGSALVADVENMTEDQKHDLMDHLQAKARIWTKLFNGQQEFSVEKKKERREVEQYLEIYPPPTNPVDTP